MPDPYADPRRPLPIEVYLGVNLQDAIDRPAPHTPIRYYPDHWTNTVHRHRPTGYAPLDPRDYTPEDWADYQRLYANLVDLDDLHALHRLMESIASLGMGGGYA